MLEHGAEENGIFHNNFCWKFWFGKLTLGESHLFVKQFENHFKSIFSLIR
jgi:hypothetical protein